MIEPRRLLSDGILHGIRRYRCKRKATQSFGLSRDHGYGRLRAMDLSNFLKMDPHLLVGLLNTELRNHCDSLTELVKTHHLDPELVIGKMAAAGYVYQPEQNQFR